jgi:hypothetical protein
MCYNTLKDLHNERCIFVVGISSQKTKERKRGYDLEEHNNNYSEFDQYDWYHVEDENQYDSFRGGENDYDDSDDFTNTYRMNENVSEFPELPQESEKRSKTNLSEKRKSSKESCDLTVKKNSENPSTVKLKSDVKLEVSASSPLFSVISLPLGKIASYYYMDYKVSHFY